MNKYYVQECKQGKAVSDWLEIYADSKEEAANKVVQGRLRRSGKPGELRVRVRQVGKTKEVDFYADPLDHHLRN